MILYVESRDGAETLVDRNAGSVPDVGEPFLLTLDGTPIGTTVTRRIWGAVQYENRPGEGSSLCRITLDISLADYADAPAPPDSKRDQHG